MIECGEHLTVHVRIEFTEIRDHARGRIDGSSDGYFHHVVVTVTVGIAAFPVDACVFGFAENRPVQPMRRRETVPSRERNFQSPRHARAPFDSAAVQSANRSLDSWSRTRSSLPRVIFGSSSFQITAAMFSHVGIWPASSGTSKFK